MISVIIPIHNVPKRHTALLNAVRSIQNQSLLPELIIVDSSDQVNRDRLSEGLKRIPGKIDMIRHITIESTGYNMPKLFNQGIMLAENDYVLCTGVDFIYSPDLMQHYHDMQDPDRFILTECQMLEKHDRVDFDRIDKWDFKEYPKNPWGKLGCGRQFFHKSWYEKSGGYDERMSGMCGMDESMFKRAEMAGLHCMWLEQGQTLHQWHPPLKNYQRPTPEMKRNWNLKDNIKHIDWRNEK